MAYVIDRLDYDRKYTVTIRALSSLQAPRLESTAVVTEFYTETCLNSNSYNFSICRRVSLNVFIFYFLPYFFYLAPGPVGNLTTELMNETIGNGRIRWDPPSHSSSTNIISGYTLKFRTLPHLSPGCNHHVELLTSIFPVGFA